MLKQLTTILIASTILLMGCATEPAKDTELKQTVAFVKYLTSKRYLSKSSFSVVYPNKQPSEFVDYMFSVMGTAEWVVTNDPMELEALKSIGIPIPPDSVQINYSHAENAEKQVVVSANDITSTIIVDAYIKDHDEPELTTNIPFKP